MTTKNKTAERYFNLFIKPETELEELQNSAIRENISVIVSACQAVKKADIAKSNASKDKNKIFADSLKDWQFLADRNSRTHLNAIRRIIEHGYDNVKTLQEKADNVSGNIKSVSGLWSAIKPKNESVKTESESEKMDIEEAQAVADMLQEKISIEDCYKNFLQSLIDNGHSPAKFWDYAISDNAEKLTAQYQKQHNAMQKQINNGKEKLAKTA